MINIESIKKEHIEKISKKKKSNKVLTEKVIRALILLEGLANSDLDFVFKGGTALMLLLGTTKRLSIDIDIIVPTKGINIEEVLAVFVLDKGFTKCEKVGRKASTGIVKEHYKIYYNSPITQQEEVILLDVLFEDIHYTNVVDTPINSALLIIDNTPDTVKTPNLDNILGDKLTAFAPNTTGIPYIKNGNEMGMEIIKQLYDVGCIVEHVENIDTVREVFDVFCTVELKYRSDTHTKNDVLNDILFHSLSIGRQEEVMECRWPILKKGIKSIKNFIFSQSLNDLIVQQCAAKAAYLSMLLKHENHDMKKYSPEVDMKDWSINQFPHERFKGNQTVNQLNKFNKYRKSNPEAFFYWYQVYRIVEAEIEQYP